MSAFDTILRLKARHGAFLTARMIESPFVRAMLWKQRMREADAVLAECGYGALPEWQTPLYLDASEQYHEAKAAHRRLISQLWDVRAMERRRAITCEQYSSQTETASARTAA